MIPAPFDYIAAESTAHAVDLLESLGDDAKLLAGGHSLLPMMKLRLAAPSVLIDIGGLAELIGIRVDGDELVIGAEWEDAGPAQTFMKVGTRNAMVIAIAGLALVVDRARRRVGVGLGSCGPTILRAPAAERFAVAVLEAHGWDHRLEPSDAELQEFGRLVATAARPIDDQRGTAAYRRHVLAVMGARALARVWSIA